MVSSVSVWFNVGPKASHQHQHVWHWRTGRRCGCCCPIYASNIKPVEDIVSVVLSLKGRGDVKPIILTLTGFLSLLREHTNPLLVIFGNTVGLRREQLVCSHQCVI